jgi:hypothetical protein
VHGHTIVTISEVEQLDPDLGGAGTLCDEPDFFGGFAVSVGARILLLAHATAPARINLGKTSAGSGWACVKRFCTEPYRVVLRYQGMDDPGTLRRKAARCFDKAASSPTNNEAKKLNEVGCQLELLADELEEIESPASRKASKRGREAETERAKSRATRGDARTHS